MNIMIIGSGGREHALAWKMATSDKVDHIYVVPGNAGTAMEAKVTNIDLDMLDFNKLIGFIHEKNIGMTVVGPELPLVAGIVDRFQEENLVILGPEKQAAQIEGSKVFAKNFMERHNIPTAKSETFTNSTKANTYLKEQKFPLVIKADGLASGKGVIIAMSYQKAVIAVNSMLENKEFGEAGCSIIIEEYLTGQELSFIVMVDKTGYVLPLASSQDHKSRHENNKGANTGGMGAFSPSPILSPALHDNIMTTIITPTVLGLKAEGLPFSGVLYAGLMIGENNQPKILEFNCRLGDPETQAIMMRLESDLFDLCWATANNNLNQLNISWSSDYALGVVMVAEGYPGVYRKNDEILGLDTTPINEKVFHAGTTLKKGKVITNGGRVICITGTGESLANVRDKVYASIKNINWPGCGYRMDIGNQD